MRLNGTARGAAQRRAGRGTILWERQGGSHHRLRRTGSAAISVQNTIGARAQRGKDT
ncbi:hypothetical protein GCM10025784_06960 [Citricoccus nitrophenolicus]